MGETYLQEAGCSLFSLKNIFTYTEEVVRGDPLRITYRVLDCSPKLLHVLLEMHHADRDYLSCFSEQLVAHVSMDTRRTSPMPDDRLELLQAMIREQSELPVPDGLGQAIAIRRK